MFSAFKQYIQSSDYKSTLKTIRVVIFRENMVKVFVNASTEESRSSRGKLYLYQFLKDLKNLLLDQISWQSFALSQI